MPVVSCVVEAVPHPLQIYCFLSFSFAVFVIRILYLSSMAHLDGQDRCNALKVQHPNSEVACI